LMLAQSRFLECGSLAARFHAATLTQISQIATTSNFQFPTSVVVY
jgi:hypothetical protein